MIAVDRGTLLALAAKDDRWHARAMAYVQQRNDDPWVSTWPVLTEACYLLSARVGVDFAHSLIRCWLTWPVAAHSCGARPPTGWVTCPA